MCFLSFISCMSNASYSDVSWYRLHYISCIHQIAILRMYPANFICHYICILHSYTVSCKVLARNALHWFVHDVILLDLVNNMTSPISLGHLRTMPTCAFGCYGDIMLRGTNLLIQKFKTGPLLLVELTMNVLSKKVWIQSLMRRRRTVLSLPRANSYTFYIRSVVRWGLPLLIQVGWSRSP